MTLVQLRDQLRPICASLEGSNETLTFGHPGWRVNTKIYAVCEEYQGELCLVVKVGKPAMGIFLRDSRFFMAPYVGRHGWVSLRVGENPDWDEITALVQGSYELVRAGKKR